MNCNPKLCPCKKKCPRHGDCKACKDYHNMPESKYKTACERLTHKKQGKQKDI